MSDRFFKVICAIVLSIGLVGQANANLISVGDIRTDANGIEWSYVDSYILRDGPKTDDNDRSCDVKGADTDTCHGDTAKTLNGIEAAELLFVLGANEIFAISTKSEFVDHLAYYDVFAGGKSSLGESITADIDGDGIYGTKGDRSAYIHDQGGADRENLVFKRVLVSEPYTLAFFALALCAMGVRRLKQ
jgi:hypothetical protein